MQYNVIYIYQKPFQPALKELFEALHEQSTSQMIERTMMELHVHTEDIEPIDYDDIHTLVMSDFDDPVTMLVSNQNARQIIPQEFIHNYLPLLPARLYDTEDILLALIKRQPQTAPLIKKRLFEALGAELIETTLALADANLNASIAAKALYMHRNTMLYRIDRIIEKTSINIKSFKGLSIFTYLYRH